MFSYYHTAAVMCASRLLWYFIFMTSQHYGTYPSKHFSHTMFRTSLMANTLKLTLCGHRKKTIITPVTTVDQWIEEGTIDYQCDYQQYACGPVAMPLLNIILAPFEVWEEYDYVTGRLIVLLRLVIVRTLLSESTQKACAKAKFFNSH